MPEHGGNEQGHFYQAGQIDDHVWVMHFPTYWMALGKTVGERRVS